MQRDGAAVRSRIINERRDWTFIVPDSIALWDAPSHWERERLASMQQHLRQGDVLYDIGTEHGWLSAVYGSFCGHGNMVLVEPSPEFWPNIRLTWQHNGFPGPIDCYVAFAAAEVSGDPVGQVWPDCADGEEIGAMAYRYLTTPQEIPSITIDEIARRVLPPDAITVDIEGAELIAMRGAAEVLDEHRPLVWVSVHPDLMERDFDHHPDQLHSFMVGHDYTGKLLGIDHEEHHFYWPKERDL